MEFMDGLSLDIVLQTVGRIEEPIVGRIAVAVAKGLHYLKTEVNILHRGIIIGIGVIRDLKIFGQKFGENPI
jgi:serine/threonine protein kinase